MKFLFIFLLSFPSVSALRPGERDSLLKKPEQLRRSVKKTEIKKLARMVAKESEHRVPVGKEKISGNKKAGNQKRISVCSHHFESKYEDSYIIWSVPCSKTKAVCFSRSELHKSKCENGKLEVKKCDSSSPKGFSVEILSCENGCAIGGIKCRK